MFHPLDFPFSKPKTLAICKISLSLYEFIISVYAHIYAQIHEYKGSLKWKVLFEFILYI